MKPAPQLANKRNMKWEEGEEFEPNEALINTYPETTIQINVIVEKAENGSDIG